MCIISTVTKKPALISGTALPFWFREQSQWREILPLLHWYEQLRGWCHPVLLRVPGVGPVLLAEIARFEMTLDLLDERARP